VLKQAITRGNGLIGEDVTHIVRQIDNVPKTIPYPGELEVRGEVIMPYLAFEEANKDNNYSNPRNFASGQLRRIDGNGISELGLKVIVFDLITPVDRVYSGLSQITFLGSNGFEVVNTQLFYKGGYDEVNKWIKWYEDEIRSTLPHMIDGLVIKTNDLDKRVEFGSTSKHPKWSIAYKFKSLDATTTLLDVIWSVGKQGQITPVAILETVNIDNVNISRATLHNVKNIKDKDIRINDRVVVKRANDVIVRP
jgi:DNA ligase (NAD+)